MWPVSFRPINKTVSKPGNPIPEEDDEGICERRRDCSDILIGCGVAKGGYGLTPSIGDPRANDQW